MSRGNPDVPDDELWLAAGPIGGWKIARLEFDGDRVVFSGVTSDLQYAVEDVAGCLRQRLHVPPEPGCGCGFYAWRHRQSATSLLDACTPALLEVELFGRFDEYAYGSIAAGQRVRSVQLLPLCSECLVAGRRSTATALTVVGGGAGALRPSCEKHDGRLVSLVELKHALSVPVRWLPLTDALEFHLELLDAELGIQSRIVRAVPVEGLEPGEVGYVFQAHLRLGADGLLAVRPDSPLVQPLPGTDVPVRRTRDGRLQALLEGVRLPPAGLRDAVEGTVPVEPVGTPVFREEVALDG